MRLSPGERARLELAHSLLKRPEFLVLDEPTNYLDIGQREWLEGFLTRFVGAVLVVSHDRVFLNRVVNRILELRRGRLRIYEGNYDDYELQRQQERRELEEKHSEQQRAIRKLEGVAAERKTWSARREATKTSAADSGFVSHRAAKMAKRAKHAERRIEQMLEQRRADKPFVEKRPRPLLAARELPDKRAIFSDGLAKSFGRRRVIGDAGFEVRTGERVALVGPNGCGKSVLLRMLVGELEPDRGVAAFGAGLRVGYFPQDLGTLDLEATALDEVMKSGASQEACRTVLGTLLLAKEFAGRKLSQLSAGERSKALLARILAAGADVLVLDEPTNHLDIDALLALEGLLARFPGAVLFATHDRAMVEKLATRTLEFRDGRLEDRRNGRAFADGKS
jgi:ATP-binding cassette subfamily F protein 3